MDARRVPRYFALLLVAGARGRNDGWLLQNLRAVQKKTHTFSERNWSRGRGDTQQTFVRSDLRLYGLSATRRDRLETQQTNRHRLRSTIGNNIHVVEFLRLDMRVPLERHHGAKETLLSRMKRPSMD